ncbi:MAG: hypothetical protein LBS90_08890 [Oscillospiraceae bacterium]|jgi:hypothetical protein|nr:hypothetical protein [Oscillospiraceae bacterium]
MSILPVSGGEYTASRRRFDETASERLAKRGGADKHFGKDASRKRGVLPKHRATGGLSPAERLMITDGNKIELWQEVH